MTSRWTAWQYRNGTERKRQLKTKLIVTGGAGFIGSNLVRALNQRGHEDIIVVDHLNHLAKERNLATLTYRQYYDKGEFRERLRKGEIAPVDGVFHLGACSSTLVTDEAYLDDNNFRYSVDLCEWALKVGARFVYASSAATYGDGSHGYRDDDAATPTLSPLNAYGRSKQKFDLWARQTGAMRKIVGLKYFNVYGPGEDHKGEMRSVICKAYRRVATEGTIQLFRSHRPEFGDGEQVRDFIHVADAVAVTLFVYDRPELSGLYNCGTGLARSWLDLGKAIFAAAGKPALIEFIDMPESIRDRYQYHTEADLTKLRRSGYSAPFLSIEDGVSRYVAEHLKLQVPLIPDQTS
jgi:ADP-L-glycero-D-manno-heptose 6-epimerase